MVKGPAGGLTEKEERDYSMYVLEGERLARREEWNGVGGAPIATGGAGAWMGVYGPCCR